MANINGVDVEKIRSNAQEYQKDPALAERNPSILAEWQGGSLTSVKLGDVVTQIGGDSNLNAMQTLLASLAACDIDLIATHASLIGLVIEKLSIEVTGHFNSRAYYGVENAPGPGYDRISYVVHLKAPGATPEQIKLLKEKCERASPVGDSLTKAIPLTIDIKTG